MSSPEKRPLESPSLREPDRKKKRSDPAWPAPDGFPVDAAMTSSDRAYASGPPAFLSTSPSLNPRPPTGRSHLNKPADGSVSSPKSAADSPALGKKDRLVAVDSPKSGVGSPGPSKGDRLVADGEYELNNLYANNIIYRHHQDEFPTHIQTFINKIYKDHKLPALSIEDAETLATLERGAAETKVAQFIRSTLIREPRPGDVLEISESRLMHRQTIPKSSSKWNVSMPKPDVLIGYKQSTFNPPQREALDTLNHDPVNHQPLRLPFFLIEFKGDGPSATGSL